MADYYEKANEIDFSKGLIMTTLTKERHAQHQLDVRQFMLTTSNKMIDFMVAQAIHSGMSDINQICVKTRCDRDKLLTGITAHLFDISGDTIRLA